MAMSIVNDYLISQNNGWYKLYTSKERILHLCLEVSWREVKGAATLTKLAFKASGSWDHEVAKVDTLIDHESSQPDLMLV